MIAAAVVWLLTGVAGQPAFDVKAHYVKQELFIPMRDGVTRPYAAYSGAVITAHRPR